MHREPAGPSRELPCVKIADGGLSLAVISRARHEDRYKQGAGIGPRDEPGEDGFYAPSPPCQGVRGQDRPRRRRDFGTYSHISKL